MIPKFRFHHSKLKCMFEVVSINFLGEKVECIVSEVDNYLNTWRWSYGELLQSTGLKDKHGVEIYDKDIVRDSYGDILLIEWLDGSFVLTDFFSGGYDHCSIDDSEAYEIVGNQFEHPHLLEE